MLTFVTWRWQPPAGYRSTFSAATVRTLKAMVDRHYPHPHRFLCVTDLPDPLGPGIEVVPDWKDFASLHNPNGRRNPSCYRRLRMFHPEIGQVFGERFVSMDLDLVITADLTPLFHRPEDVVFYGDTNPLPGSHYNGSLVLMTAGARPHVWTDFDPRISPKRSLAAKCFGSDQGWISYRLGKGEKVWTVADGVYSFRKHLQKPGSKLPANARVIVFHGAFDPWQPRVHATHPWVKTHYREAA